MIEQKPLVKNASDPSQIAEAKKKSVMIRDDELKDIRWVISDPRGFRFCLRLLRQCKTLESVWSPSALIHYNAGQQDIGHFLMSEFKEADYNTLLKMMLEAIKTEEKNG